MWFDGPIDEAVNKTKCEKTFLIVYVYDNDENSNVMSNCWQDDEIKSYCNENKFVALKFDGKSEEAKQFSVFYPLVSIPSIFFIDYEGKPLEIIVKSITAPELKSQLQKAVLMNENKQGSSNEAANCTLPSDNNVQTTTAPESSSTVDHVKNLIKQNNENNEKQEAENEKLREINRREEGRSIMQAREKQKEREILAAAEERKRDKKADREHLRVLREQIAADRAEKKAAYEASKESERLEQEKRKQEKMKKMEEENEKKKQEIAERCKFTKLQFRMPDGSVFSETFNSDQLLSDAFNFVESSLDLREKFYLIQMYPRREFTDSDMGKTFIELDLAPSAVLMVLQERRRNVQMQPYQENWFFWIFSFITCPFLLVYNWIYSLFYGTGTTREGRPPAGSSSQSRSATGSFGREEGNVHRMPNGGQRDDNPDDNATWNGNSTQQL